MNKIVIFSIFLFLSACAREIMYLNHANFNHAEEQLVLTEEQYISRTWRQFCFLFICTRYNYHGHDIDFLNQFIYSTIMKANGQGIEGNAMTDIGLRLRGWDFMLIKWTSVRLQGAIIYKTNN